MSVNPASTDDQTLLRAFAERREEAAFRVIVDRYAGLVFGVAMRRTSRAEGAEEVAQNVFLALAAKAGTLGEVRSLAAWLHRAATLESLKFLRTEATRQRHLAMIRDHQDTEAAGHASGTWKEVRPHLDSLLDRLPERDREVLMLHYFEGLSFSEIAARTGLGAAAAQKRGVRALEKLSRLLGKRGVVATAAVLGVGLTTELAPAAPVGFAKGVATAVLHTTAAGVAGGSTFIATLTAMLSTKAAFATAFVLAAAIPVAREMTRQPDAAEPIDGIVIAPHSAANVTPSAPAPASGDRLDPAVFRAELKRIQANPEPDDDAINRLRRLMFTLAEAEIAEALAVLDEFENPEPLRDIVGATYARWAELDPEAAIVAAGASPPNRWGYYPINGAWQTWAFSDWEAARVWARDTKTEYDHAFLYWGVLDKLGELDGMVAVKRAGQLADDDPDSGDAYLTRALSSWARHEPEAALAWMDGNLAEPVKRDNLIGDALEGLGDEKPAVALDHVGLIGNPERLREVRSNIYWQWVLNQPGLAAEYLASSGAGENWDANTLRSAGEGLARNEPARALEVARGIVDPAGRDAMFCGILCAAGERDPLLVVEAAEAISEEAARTNNSLGGFLRAWSEIDAPAAAAWVSALPEGGKKEWAQHMLPQ